MTVVRKHGSTEAAIFNMIPVMDVGAAIGATEDYVYQLSNPNNPQKNLSFNQAIEISIAHAKAKGSGGELYNKFVRDVQAALPKTEPLDLFSSHLKLSGGNGEMASFIYSATHSDSPAGDDISEGEAMQGVTIIEKIEADLADAKTALMQRINKH